MIVTDGRSDDPDATWRTAMSLRNEEDAFLIAVGIGNNIRQLELEGIASEPLSNNVMTVESFDDLGSIEDDLIDTICDGMKNEILHYAVISCCVSILQNLQLLHCYVHNALQRFLNVTLIRAKMAADALN